MKKKLHHRAGHTRALTIRELERRVRAFNHRYPVGTPCRLRMDTKTIDTRIASEAFILQGHSAVACFEGVSGCYSIEDDRVSPIEEGRAA